MSTTVYDIGDRVRLYFDVTSTAGVYVNTGVKLVVNKPSGTKLEWETSSTNSTAVDHYSTGKWQKYITVDQAGRWTYQAYSTGSAIVSQGGAFAVRTLVAST